MQTKPNPWEPDKAHLRGKLTIISPHNDKCSPSLRSIHGGAYLATKPHHKEPNTTHTYHTPGNPKHANLKEGLTFTSPHNDKCLPPLARCQPSSVLTFTKMSPRSSLPRHETTSQGTQHHANLSHPRKPQAHKPQGGAHLHLPSQ